MCSFQLMFKMIVKLQDEPQLPPPFFSNNDSLGGETLHIPSSN